MFLIWEAKIGFLSAKWCYYTAYDERFLTNFLFRSAICAFLLSEDSLKECSFAKRRLKGLGDPIFCDA